jgi:hypothetical protein
MSYFDIDPHGDRYDRNDYRDYMEKPTGTVRFALDCGLTVTAKVILKVSHDPNYGADADGNRGVPMDEVEVVEAVEDSITIEDDSAMFSRLSKRNQERILDEIYMADVDCDF